MKKNYICPDMEVVEIGFNHPLLAGSGDALSDPIPPGMKGSSPAPGYDVEDFDFGEYF